MTGNEEKRKQNSTKLCGWFWFYHFALLNLLYDDKRSTDGWVRKSLSQNNPYGENIRWWSEKFSCSHCVVSCLAVLMWHLLLTFRWAYSARQLKVNTLMATFDDKHIFLNNLAVVFML